jgi:hypothetical protein
MTRRLGWIVVLFCQLALVPASGEGHAQQRVALVIGNSNYQYTRQLANPINDAEDLAAELRRVGFTVDFQHDLTKKGMEEAIARFARLAQGADAALFFYAGHGMQYRGENYLMPVDARLQDEFSLNFELTRLDDVLFGLERAQGVKILILDACRNNPLLEHLLRTTKSASRDLIATHGLAKVDAARGMLVAYSTQPNQVAVDGAGRNSPFTSALVKYIAVPGLEVGTLFRRVAIEVNRVTKGRQLPELSVSLVGEFYLNTQDTDAQAWSKIRATDNTTKLNDFLKTYPTSPLAAEAHDKLAAIEQQERAQIERERAERDRLEKERLAREDVERKEHELEAAKKTARLEKERVAQAQAEKAREAQAEHERLAKEQADHDKVAREKVALAEKSKTSPQHDDAAKIETNAGAQTKTAMLTPPDNPAPLPKGKTPTDEPAKQNAFDGSWSITWTGVAHCSGSNSYGVRIQKGILTCGKSSGEGRVFASGAAKWHIISHTGARVNYSGVLQDNGGHGQFRNERGCQGTFVAKRITGNQFKNVDQPSNLKRKDAPAQSRASMTNHSASKCRWGNFNACLDYQKSIGWPHAERFCSHKCS